MKKANEVIKELADLIEANPECVFEIDNDGWYIMSHDRSRQIATSGDFYVNSRWHGDSSNYGSGLAIAMIEILNRKGFNIISESV